MNIDDVEVLAFDVFGTVVDWYTSVAAEVAENGLAVDAGRFALAWRARYAPTLQRVAAGELGWAPLDDLHRLMLDDCLDEFGVHGLGEERKRHLTLAWHRLRPWPDSVEGLTRLKRRFVVCTLSNGNIGLLTRMAKFAGLPWDCILSAENVGRYKPDPATYLGVGRILGAPPSRVLMVAAHHDDLAGARRCGLLTAYVERPEEFGPQGKDVAPDPANTLHVEDLRDLAARLGC
jgi:2-haloacid dehalogenase